MSSWKSTRYPAFPPAGERFPAVCAFRHAFAFRFQGRRGRLPVLRADPGVGGSGAPGVASGLLLAEERGAGFGLPLEPGLYGPPPPPYAPAPAGEFAMRPVAAFAMLAMPAALAVTPGAPPSLACSVERGASYLDNCPAAAPSGPETATPMKPWRWPPGPYSWRGSARRPALPAPRPSRNARALPAPADPVRDAGAARRPGPLPRSRLRIPDPDMPDGAPPGNHPVVSVRPPRRLVERGLHSSASRSRPVLLSAPNART